MNFDFEILRVDCISKENYFSHFNRKNTSQSLETPFPSLTLYPFGYINAVAIDFMLINASYSSPVPQPEEIYPLVPAHLPGQSNWVGTGASPHFVVKMVYTRTSMAGTLMARLQRQSQTRFLVPWKKNFIAADLGNLG